MHATQSRCTTGGAGITGSNMHTNRSHRGRNAFLATLFAATVAAGITGATYTGVTKETSTDEACAHVTWPNIPAYCLEGATDRVVRIVSVDRDNSSFAERFAVAFQ